MYGIIVCWSLCKRSVSECLVWLSGKLLSLCRTVPDLDRKGLKKEDGILNDQTSVYIIYTKEDSREIPK